MTLLGGKTVITTRGRQITQFLEIPNHTRKKFKISYKQGEKALAAIF